MKLNYVAVPGLILIILACLYLSFSGDNASDYSDVTLSDKLLITSSVDGFNYELFIDKILYARNISNDALSVVFSEPIKGMFLSDSLFLLTNDNKLYKSIDKMELFTPMYVTNFEFIAFDVDGIKEKDNLYYYQAKNKMVPLNY